MDGLDLNLKHYNQRQVQICVVPVHLCTYISAYGYDTDKHQSDVEG